MQVGVIFVDADPSVDIDPCNVNPAQVLPMATMITFHKNYRAKCDSMEACASSIRTLWSISVDKDVAKTDIANTADTVRA